MNDEIKEILDNFKCYEERYKKCNETQFIIFYRDIHLLLDYITNLQEEIERLRNEIKKISEQHIYTLDKLIETQTRIEKTIEYIKENGYIDLNGYDLLKITGCDEE